MANYYARQKQVYAEVISVRQGAGHPKIKYRVGNGNEHTIKNPHIIYLPDDQVEAKREFMMEILKS